MIPNKLPYIPKSLVRTPCHVVINQEGLTEDGEEKAAIELDTKCCFSEKRRQILTAEKQLIQLEGSAILLEDPAPGIQFSSGTFTISGKEYRIHIMKRPRNPDGSVHHTTLELM